MVKQILFYFVSFIFYIETKELDIKDVNEWILSIEDKYGEIISTNKNKIKIY